MDKFLKIQRYLLICVALLLGSCGETPSGTPVQTETVSFSKEGTLELLQQGTDSVLVLLEIELAETDYETQTGLMYRQAMTDRQGMLFVFETPALHSFYMKNTLIPLDILFINDQLEVVTIRKNAQPLDETGISSGVPVQYVLEVKAGLADRWGVTPGDRIRYRKDP